MAQQNINLGTVANDGTGDTLRDGGTKIEANFTELYTATAALRTNAQGDLFYSSATNTVAKLAKSTSATRYLGNTGTSNAPAWTQIDLTNGVTGDLPFANLAQGSALSVLGVTGNSTADLASIAAASDGQVLRRSGTAVAFGAVDLAGANAVTGALTVANGGTGRATSTTANALLAAGTTATGAHQTLAAGATTEILVGGGASALPVWTTATGTGAPVREGSPTFTGTLTAAGVSCTSILISGNFSLNYSSTVSFLNGDNIRFRNLSTSTNWTTINTSGVNIHTGALLMAGTQVVTSRRTGWAAATGTATRTSIATYTAPTITNPPTQAEVQAIADALQAWTRHNKASTDDLITHGLFGA